MQLAHMTVGDGQPLFVIAGPCVIETESLIMSTAETLKQIGEDLGCRRDFQKLLRQGEPVVD
jgi:2-dehydro-3-deoxyphosphooctonate aldolase (KDO 8-P synthase)